jgi:hypothetical protein
MFIWNYCSYHHTVKQWKKYDSPSKICIQWNYNYLIPLFIYICHMRFTFLQTTVKPIYSGIYNLLLIMFFKKDINPLCIQVPFLHLFFFLFLYVITYYCYLKVLHVCFYLYVFNLLSLFGCTDMYISYYFSSLKNKSFIIK